MIRRFGLLYTLFSILVLIVLAVLVLARLSNARSANLDEARASFRRLQAQIEQVALDPPAALGSSSPASRQLSGTINAYTTIVPTARAIVLFHQDHGLRYVWASRTDALTVSPREYATFRGFPDYNVNDVGQVQFRKQLSSRESDGYYLDAVYQVLDFEDAYAPLRDSLISLLVFAFFTVLVVLALGRASPRSDSRPVGDEAEPGVRTAPASSPTPAAPGGRTGASAPDTGSADEPRYEEIAIEEIATEPGEPGTLFNPVTGLSHREHLERRLGLELERSAYNDQDLTCAIIRFPGLEGAEVYTERARDVLAAFQFEDLCFEYDRDSFCVVLPNTELPQGLRQAESFKKRHPHSVIGLSARNGRLVEAHRVLKEADRSLSHAEHEAGGIVGFRPDPRKYRQFVTEHLASE